MRKLLIIFLFAISGFAGLAQRSEVVLQYISVYRDAAVVEMQRTGVPASITLAQGIHETMAGTSELVLKSNNHFGIKCKSNWTGESVTHDDDRRGECFRKYDDPLDSYRDHSDFLKSGPRYAFLFNIDPLDYKDWAYGLKKAGYATNPKYPVILIKLIEDYGLQDYTLFAMGKLTKEEMLAKMTPGIDENPVSVAKNEAPVVAVAAVEVIEEKPDYPSGEFRINDTRVVFARKDMSYLAIAQQYNVPMARLFEFNELSNAEVVDKDRLIFLQRKRKTGQNEFHIVKQGETLHDIASKEGMRIESLLEYNHLTASSRPAVGEQLYLRRKAPATPRLEARLAASNRTEVE
jgi:LysM repeat protein